MPEPISLSIGSDGQSRADEVSLQEKIKQIIDQRGPFRYITEQGLLDDIAKGRDGKDTTVNPKADEDEAVDATPEKQQEELWRAREEMMKQLERASNEIFTALDFVSLTLSKEGTSAQGSLSPALKQAVPIGSLDVRIIEPPRMSQTQVNKLDKVSHGWRSQVFQSAHHKIEAASTRLTIEADRESKYWEQVAALKRTGWSISRLPRNTTTVAVHFGSPDSAVQFRQKGWGLLLQKPDGLLTLDRRSQTTSQKVLTVEVRRHGRQTGRHIPGLQRSDSVESIETQVENARDFLFEEELFYEISREARLIAGQDIVTRTNEIELEIDPELCIILKYQIPRSLEQPEMGEDAILAKFIAQSLRLHLLAAHGNNLQTRSTKPVPVSQYASRTIEYNILRPVLDQAKHNFFRENINKMVQQAARCLANANLLLECHHGKNIISDPFHPSSTKVAIDSTGSSLQTSLVIKLPSRKKFNITILTQRSPPIYGSLFQCSELQYSGNTIHPSEYNNLQDLNDFIFLILTIDLVYYACSLRKQPILISEQDKGDPAEWTPQNPFAGEIVLLRHDEMMKQAQILLRPTSFAVKVTGNRDAASKRETWYTWDKTSFRQFPSNEDLGSPSEKTFDEVLQLLIADVCHQA